MIFYLHLSAWSARPTCSHGFLLLPRISSRAPSTPSQVSSTYYNVTFSSNFSRYSNNFSDSHVNFYVYSLWLTRMGQRLTVEAGPESLAALNGLAEKANTPSVAIRPISVPDPTAHVPVLPVYLQIRL